MGESMIRNMRAVDTSGQEVAAKFAVKESHGEWQIRLTNDSGADVAIKEVVIFKGEFGEAEDGEMLFVEGYEMLSQMYKPLGEVDGKESTMSNYHYKLPSTAGMAVGYNYMYRESKSKCSLIGATSCRSYTTEIRYNRQGYEVVQCLEGRVARNGDSILLESFTQIEGHNRNEALAIYAEQIKHNHAILDFKEVPDGWCSWYCYGPKITEPGLNKNLEAAKNKKVAGIKYIQIDDGYQPHMGDWLKQTEKFKSSMKDICINIEKSGFEAAMWVAPFIASEKSEIFAQHPDWFIKDASGNPLSAADCTFRGWRDAPWYFMDLTNNDAKKYIQHVFKTMKNDWGVDYFKLDANAWGGLPFGQRCDNSLTSVEAYRLGMMDMWQAVEGDEFVKKVKAAEKDCISKDNAKDSKDSMNAKGKFVADTFMLGCNAPLFPSIGVVNGMRIGSDIFRHMHGIKEIARQCFYRNWMHGALWISDPDCLIQNNSILLHTNISMRKHSRRAGMYRYEAAFVRASGGMILSGDKLFGLDKYKQRIMQELMSSPRISAQFNFDYSEGTISYDNTSEFLLFNESGRKRRQFEVNCGKGKLIDMFAGCESKIDNSFKVTLKPNDARWYKFIKE